MLVWRSLRFFLVDSTKAFGSRTNMDLDTAVGNNETSAWNRNSAKDADSVVLCGLAIHTDGIKP
jgi:hypothetical protein